jgi:hypothetical protein
MGRNESRVILPPGFNRAQMKMQVRRAARLDANEKNLLTFALDQAETYCFLGVSQIKKELGWGEKRWIRTRDLLEKKGIYRWHGLINVRGSIDWKMVFDFNEFEYQSFFTNEKEGVMGARAIPPSGGDYVRSNQQDGITGDPHAKGGSEPNVLTTNQRKPQLKEVVVGEEKNLGSVDEEELPGAGLHWPPGLSCAQQQVMSAGLSGVEQVRRQELLDELAGRMGSRTQVRDPCAVLRKLVLLAQAGSLVCELAFEIRASREARMTNQKRLKTLSTGAGGVFGPVGKNNDSNCILVQSMAAQTERAKLRVKRAEWMASK